MSGYIKSMKDLEAATYGIKGGQGNSLLKAAGVVGGLGSSHDGSAGLLTGTGPTAVSSLYNIAYGKKVWSMINQECNALAMLAKRPYTASGWRVLEKRAGGGGNSKISMSGDSATLAKGADTLRPDALGAYGENAAIDSGADSTAGTISAITPTYAQLKTSPKTVAHLFEFSELALEMAKIDDGVGDIRALIREDMGKHHAEMQNAMLLMPLEDYNLENSAARADQNYTSLMKIVSSSAELTDMYNEDFGFLNQAKTSSDVFPNEMADLFGTTARRPTVDGAGSSGVKLAQAVDAGYLDSYVDFGTSYASTRPLTLTILNKALRNIREAGGSPKVILTGYDTIQHLGDLLQSQERFMDRKEIIPTHNGVRGVKGSEVGFRVATYFDIPIIPCKDMPSTTKTAAATDLSDILILDTDHIWLSVMKPTQYFEDGIDHGNPFGVAKLGNQAMYRTIAETGCSFFKGQGKITNLSSA
tara:strand:+ start:209 stop:1627 length:1419 start_codon:yes stop_codon:yes gene_type:complete